MNGRWLCDDSTIRGTPYAASVLAVRYGSVIHGGGLSQHHNLQWRPGVACRSAGRAEACSRGWRHIKRCTTVNSNVASICFGADMEHNQQDSDGTACMNLHVGRTTFVDTQAKILQIRGL